MVFQAIVDFFPHVLIKIKIKNYSSFSIPLGAIFEHNNSHFRSPELEV